MTQQKRVYYMSVKSSLKVQSGIDSVYNEHPELHEPGNSTQLRYGGLIVLSVTVVGWGGIGLVLKALGLF